MRRVCDVSTSRAFWYPFGQASMCVRFRKAREAGYSGFCIILKSLQGWFETPKPTSTVGASCKTVSCWHVLLYLQKAAEVKLKAAEHDCKVVLDKVDSKSADNQSGLVGLSAPFEIILSRTALTLSPAPFTLTSAAFWK